VVGERFSAIRQKGKRTVTGPFRLAKGLVLERFGDQAVVFNPEGPRFLVINRASADLLFICKRAMGRRDFDKADLAAVVRSQFSLTAEQAAREAVRFLSNWKKAGIFIPSVY